MPEYNDILTEIYKVLTPFAKEDHPLSEESELVADLGLDSMQVMRLLLEIEDHFDVSIPINVLPDIRTIRDFAQQLEKILN
jgi:acyl carrier protein